MKPQPAECVSLNVVRLAATGKPGRVVKPLFVAWSFDADADGRVRLTVEHDGKRYAIPLVPWRPAPFGGWAASCPTCGARVQKLWLTPHRYVFQCRLCAGVATWHNTRDRHVNDIAIIAGRIKRLRRRYRPVERPTPRWLHGIARIAALEDRLLELVNGTVEIGN